MNARTLRGIVTHEPIAPGRPLRRVIRIVRDISGNGHSLPEPSMPVGTHVVIKFTSAAKFIVEANRG